MRSWNPGVRTPQENRILHPTVPADTEAGGLEAVTARTCTIEGCDRKHKAKGYCKLHYDRDWLRGSTDDRPRRQNLPGANNPGWKGSNITYGSAHSRVTRHRGKASSHTCECGTQASDWAYNLSDPDELATKESDRSAPTGTRYSANPDHYTPMCRPCHRRFDAQEAQKEAEAA
ncbi:HNH endonuclease [Gordonia phage Octobien14]|uniref:HNH endonuclease n=1 Tax=Gordonia phage Octobien14 TaxID=2483673 RepID=A0A3G3M9Q1_9CAUD|nr:HNH endonuclease [Gordonia phage Octobien14]AYR03149.1 HNH endonuclease [Gordonia phage Octobien14]